MRPVFVRWKCSGCGKMNMVSVPSGYVWEKELACRTCHQVLADAAAPAYQIPINIETRGKHTAGGSSGHKH